MQIHELNALGRSPTSGDQLVIDTGAVTAKIDYNLLADTMLSKLVKKFFSSVNIDDVKQTCLAYCSGATGTNIPAEGYGQLWVIADSGLGNGTRVTQIFVSAFNKDIWIRQYTGSPVAWSNWTKILAAGKIPMSAGGTGLFGENIVLYNNASEIAITQGTVRVFENASQVFSAYKFIDLTFVIQGARTETKRFSTNYADMPFKAGFIADNSTDGAVRLVSLMFKGSGRYITDTVVKMSYNLGAFSTNDSVLKLIGATGWK